LSNNPSKIKVYGKSKEEIKMIRNGFINDDTYKCSDCEEEFQVFSKSGSTTNFCPSCASRDIEPIDEEDE